MFEFAPSFFFTTTLLSASDFTPVASVGVLWRGLAVLDTVESVSSSSSVPNDSLPLVAILRFFLKTGFGVDALYFVN